MTAEPTPPEPTPTQPTAPEPTPTQPTAPEPTQPTTPEPTPTRPTQPTPTPKIAGLLLAAGGGRRLGGRPKALLPHRGRPLVENAIRVLRDAGCDPIHVVLGASAAEVRERADLSDCTVVDNPDWAEGMGSSLRLGLASLASSTSPTSPTSPTDATPRPQAALVSLVDQPGIGPEALKRVLAAYRSPASLAAAAYDGERGHPVLFGSDRWADIAATATGDRGARVHLTKHAAELTLVECADIAEPYDIDTPEDLGRLE